MVFILEENVKTQDNMLKCYEKACYNQGEGDKWRKYFVRRFSRDNSAQFF